jgi:predicted dehydrogenase
MHRRQFLVTAASAQRVFGANERVVVGLIGCGGRGSFVARHMRDSGGAVFGAVCDVYEPNAAKAREWAGAEARMYRDFRRLLEQKDIDAVLIATPDHWHAIPTILACEAGKHVYVEKPLAHNIREGRAMVEAARRHKRIVQTGTQQRSAPHFREVAEIIQSGKLGHVHLVRVWNYFNSYPEGIGREPDSEPPPGLDWDFYLGPAPWVPFNRKRFLGTYRLFWDYSGGYITDFGTHRFDTVHQILGAEAPVTIAATGGRFAMADAGEMPDVMQVTYEYPGFILSYEMCALNSHGVGGRTPQMSYYRARGADDRPHGMAFYGTNGAIFADRIGYEIYPEGDRIAAQRKNVPDATPLHAKNFIDAIRGLAQPAAPVEIGHRSTAVAHLGNIAYLTGRKIQWNAQKEECTGDAGADRLLRRKARKPWDLVG